MLKYEDVKLVSNLLEYNGVIYDIDLAVKKDIEQIIGEAEKSHGVDFKALYDRNSIRPDKIRVFLDKDGEPAFGLVTYVIKYKSGDNGRYACGNYYPFYKVSLDKNLLMPHPFQASICW